MGHYNEYRLHIPEEYNSQIVFKSGITIHQEIKFNSEEKVASKGIVSFVPDFIIKDDNNGRPLEAVAGKTFGIAVGDVVFIRYDVVGTSELDTNGNRTHENAFVYEYTDESGQVNKRKEWFCSIDQIYAVERDGKMIMKEGFVLCKQHEVVTEKVGLIYVPEMSKVKKTDNVAVVVNMCEQTGRNKRNISEGDKVYTDLRYAGKYNFSGIYGDDVFVVELARIEMKLP